MSERMSDEELLANLQAVAGGLRGDRFGKSALCRIASEARRAREAEARLQEIVNSVSVALSGAVPLPGFRGNDLGSLVLSERRRFRSEAEAIRAELRKHIVAADDVPAVQPQRGHGGRRERCRGAGARDQHPVAPAASRVVD